MAFTGSKFEGYSDANCNITRENFAGEAGGAATTEYCKFRSFQAAKLKGVHAVVTVAGTATSHAFDIYHGTDSIATLALAKSAAGATLSAVPAEALAAGDQVSVKSTDDQAGKAHIIYEYEVASDAVHN